MQWLALSLSRCPYPSYRKTFLSLRRYQTGNSMPTRRQLLLQSVGLSSQPLVPCVMTLPVQ